MSRKSACKDRSSLGSISRFVSARQLDLIYDRNNVYRGSVKYTDYAFNKTTVYKRKSRNHLSDQIESFRIGDKDNKREDDLLDTFCYGIALALGDGSGF